ncbi:2288_t:CDS:2, partial [Racocetra persica]
ARRYQLLAKAGSSSSSCFNFSVTLSIRETRSNSFRILEQPGFSQSSLKSIFRNPSEFNYLNYLPRSLEIIQYSTELRPDCKLTETVPLLDKHFGEFGRCSKCLQRNTKFLTEIANAKLVDNGDNVIKYYGISQDLETKNYIMVMQYAEEGNLRQYLQQKNKELSLKDKLDKLRDIINGLK